VLLADLLSGLGWVSSVICVMTFNGGCGGWLDGPESPGTGQACIYTSQHFPCGVDTSVEALSRCLSSKPWYLSFFESYRSIVEGPNVVAAFFDVLQVN
jgi:hypothetical protein